jgi:hypothetical protein
LTALDERLISWNFLIIKEALRAGNVIELNSSENQHVFAAFNCQHFPRSAAIQQPQQRKTFTFSPRRQYLC